MQKSQKQKSLKQMSQKQKLSFITQAGVIGALYGALTIFFAIFAPYMTFGGHQFRVSEALTVLPLFFPAAIPGLFVGCIVGNFTGFMIGVTPVWDIIFGSLASLMAAYCTRMFRDKFILRFKNEVYNIPIIALLPPIIFNAIIVGPMVSIVFEWPLIPMILSVGLGQIGVISVLGIPLMIAIRKSKIFKYIG